MEVFEWVLGLVLSYLLLRWLWRLVVPTQEQQQEQKKLSQSSLRKAKSIIRKHKSQLAIQRLKSIHSDSYGKSLETNWQENEIPYFIENHIRPGLDAKEQGFLWAHTPILTQEINRIASSLEPKTVEYNPKMTGFDFEAFCAAKLETEGWKVQATKAGPDQGVDLIITKKKRIIGVQCKKYSKPIGNKAVQEIKSGISHYGLSEAIVLSNNRFTKAAIELANTNNVKLLHYLETSKI